MESRDATRSSVDMGALLGNTSNSLGHAANEEDGAGIGDLVEVDDDVEELQKLDMARILLKTS